MFQKEKSNPGHELKKFHFDNIFKDNPRFYESIVLYQIGDLNCESGYSFGEHMQYCYEISCIVAGKGVFYNNGHTYPIKQGDLFLNKPGELHNYKADSKDPFRFFYLGFNFNDKPAEPNSLLHIKKLLDQVENPLILDNMKIQDYFVKIFNELINARSYSDLLIKLNLQQIVIFTYRNYFDCLEDSYGSKSNIDETKKIVYEIVNYIDMYLYNISALTEIAEDLGYSYSHLSHAFSRETGLTIKEYFDQKRFEKAIEMLKSSGLSIGRIAETLQYQSIHPFSTAFRKRFGISPSEYQSIFHKM